MHRLFTWLFPTFFQKAIGMAATLYRAKTKFDCHLRSIKGSSITRCMWLGFWTASFESRTLAAAAAAAAKSLQSCLTLCDPIDRSPPGSSVPGILQARTLEWVAISCSSAWKWKVKLKSLSRVWLFAIPWTAAYQAPPSMGVSRQEYWSGVPLPSPNSLYSPPKK